MTRTAAKPPGAPGGAPRGQDPGTPQEPMDRSPIPLLFAWFVAPLVLVLLLARFDLGGWLGQLFGF